MAAGNYNQIFTVGEVRKQADVTVASNDISAGHLMKTAKIMNKVARNAKDNSHYLPYLEVAVDRTADSKDEKVLQGRAHLMPDYALHIEKDADRAVALRKEVLPETWMEDGKELNNFAWWCFENNINLHEAEAMARKGIELSKDGIDKANVIDTLAEICNLKGDCGDAVEIIRMAIAEAPDNQYFKDQLVRFEALYAEQRASM